MSIHEPSRGGNRGGKDDFTWDGVKVDKHRENYLAHSLMAPVGRWQKGRDLSWYTKGSKVTGQKEQLKKEMTAIKLAEEEAMARALGLKTAPSIKPSGNLTKEEIAEVCKRRIDDGETESVPQERMKGVGFKSRRSDTTNVITSTSKDGVTTFEHDPSLSAKTDRLVLQAGPRKRLSSSVSSDQQTLTSPTKPTASPLQHESESRSSKKKKDKKKKKQKKGKEKRKHKERESRSGSIDSSEEEWLEKKEIKRNRDRKKSRKRRQEKRHDSFSDSETSSEDEEEDRRHGRHDKRRQDDRKKRYENKDDYRERRNEERYDYKRRNYEHDRDKDSDSFKRKRRRHDSDSQ